MRIIGRKSLPDFPPIADTLWKKQIETTNDQFEHETGIRTDRTNNKCQSNIERNLNEEQLIKLDRLK